MKLSEIKGEKAIDVIAEIIEPATEIFQDEKVIEEIKNGSKPKAVKMILKNHKNSVIEILAALDGVSVEEYEINLFTLPKKILEILNDKELLELF